MPAPYFIPGRSVGGFIAHNWDWRSWTISAGIWGGGEIMAVDDSETSTGKCITYNAGGTTNDLNIVGVTAMGNEVDRVYGTIPTATPPSDEDKIGILDMVRGELRLANDNSGAITHGDLLSAEEDSQTIEGNATQTVTAVDIAAFTVLADTTDVTGAELRLVLREANKIVGRSNEDHAQNTSDQEGINTTLLLCRPEIVVPSA